jgi:hypothetical protein
MHTLDRDKALEIGHADLTRDVEGRHSPTADLAEELELA